MEQQSVTHHTFVIERNYPASPERVFAALSDPAKKRRWFGDHSTDAFEMDFRVGGMERSHSRISKGPLQGTPLSSEGTYQDIVPDRRIVIAARMILGDHCISAALATFELRPDRAGTTLVFTHQAAFFEGADGPQMREAGWRQLLDQLGREIAGPADSQA